ncbi:MAG: arginine--tRNA ligase [Coriobacteriia bacterium]|nr:arginine--tRNA ligase [Coriobacteriia bacterium]
MKGYFVKSTVSGLVYDALTAAIDKGELTLGSVPDPAIERPRDVSHGDWATMVALRCAKEANMTPRAVAEIIAAHLTDTDDIESVDIAGPGFINVHLSQAALAKQLKAIRLADTAYGSSQNGRGQKVQVEFVSANPVGPMHVGHGRWAALGDSMARVLSFTGHEVQREFYINDAGVQMDTFGRSVSARYLELCGIEVEFPEEGYQGAYIKDIAQEIFNEEGASWAEATPQERQHHFKELAYKQVLAHLQKVLHDFGVDFDVWFSERTLRAKQADGATAIEKAIAALTAAGFIYEKDGALWFRSTDFKDDKDRVLVKADGDYTYFAADIAYHQNKFDRGFDRVIDIWGADHHGYVARMKGACAALGHEGKLDVVIGQLVNLFRSGKLVRMSKRTGEMVTFEELVEETGADASRYWFLRRSTDQQVDFDIDLAREQSSDNPIYYVQYAHARICSIIRKAFNAPGDAAVDVLSQKIAPDTDLSFITEAAELDLIRKLTEFPEVVEAASAQLAPSKLTRYAEDLAATFHHFYSQCRVMHDDTSIADARLFLVDATRRTLRNVFSLLGIQAPERM